MLLSDLAAEPTTNSRTSAACKNLGTMIAMQQTGSGKDAFFQKVDLENQLRDLYQRWDARLSRFSPDSPDHRALIVVRDNEVAALWAGSGQQH